MALLNQNTFTSPNAFRTPDTFRQPMGLRAKSPTTNTTAPPTTLPKNQIQTTGTESGDIAAGYIKGPTQPTQPDMSKLNLSGTQAVGAGPGGGSIGQTNSGVAQPFTPNTGLYGQLITGLANQSLQPGAAFQAALPQYQQAVQNLGGFNQQLAQKYGAIESTPIPLEFQQGREQVLARQAASEQQALQGAVQQQQTALGFGLQQQGLTQQALQGAAGLAAPAQVPYTTQFVSPITGQSVQPSGGQFGTGPAAAANVQSIQGQTQQVNDWSAARQSANNLQNQLTTFIQQNGINPSDFNAVNRFLQQIGAQTSSPQYQTFSNLVNDLANQYATILTPAGGSQTDMVRSIAQSMINATASGQSIGQVLQNLDLQAQNKISGVQQNVQNLQSGQNVNQPASSGGSLWSW